MTAYVLPKAVTFRQDRTASSRLKLRWVIPVWVRPPPAAPPNLADIASEITTPLAAIVALRGVSSSSCPRLVHGRLHLLSEERGIDRRSRLALHVRGDVRLDVGSIWMPLWPRRSLTIFRWTPYFRSSVACVWRVPWSLMRGTPA